MSIIRNSFSIEEKGRFYSSLNPNKDRVLQNLQRSEPFRQLLRAHNVDAENVNHINFCRERCGGSLTLDLMENGRLVSISLNGRGIDPLIIRAATYLLDESRQIPDFNQPAPPAPARGVPAPVAPARPVPAAVPAPPVPAAPSIPPELTQRLDNIERRLRELSRRFLHNPERRGSLESLSSVSSSSESESERGSDSERLSIRRGPRFNFDRPPAHRSRSEQEDPFIVVESPRERDDLDPAMNQLRDQIGQLQQILGQGNAAIQALQNRIQALENRPEPIPPPDLHPINARLTALEQAAQQEQLLRNEFDQTRQTMEHRFQNQNLQINQNLQRMTQLQQDLNHLSGNIQQLSDHLNGRLDHLTDAIPRILNGRINDVQSQLSSLLNRLRDEKASIEERIDALENALLQRNVPRFIASPIVITNILRSVFQPEMDLSSSEDLSIEPISIASSESRDSSDEEEHSTRSPWLIPYNPVSVVRPNPQHDRPYSSSAPPERRSLTPYQKLQEVTRIDPSLFRQGEIIPAWAQNIGLSRLRTIHRPWRNASANLPSQNPMSPMTGKPLSPAVLAVLRNIVEREQHQSPLKKALKIGAQMLARVTRALPK